MLLSSDSDSDPPSTLIGWLTPLWLISIVIGAFLLPTIGSSEGNEMTPDRALFTAVNAATLTGFSGAGMESLLWPGRMVILLLTVFGAFYALVMGGHLLCRAVGLHYTDRQIMRTTLVIEAFLLFGVTPFFLPITDSVIPAAQLAIGAFANSGVSWGRLPDATSWATHVIILPLTVLGGLGIPVILELWNWLLRRNPLSAHTDISTKLTAAVYLLGVVGMLGLFFFEYGDVPPRAAMMASVSAVDARSLGLDIVPLSTWPTGVSWCVMGLMLIGACPGSAGGGLFVTTFATLWTGVRRSFTGAPAGRPFAIVCVWIAMYALAVGVTVLALVATAGQGAGDRLLFLAISALGTVGLSHDPISLVGPPLHILTIAMLLGRLAPLAMLWWLGRARRPFV